MFCKRCGMTLRALPALYGELAHAGQVAEIHHYFATSPDVGVRVIAHTATHRPALAVAGDERSNCDI